MELKAYNIPIKTGHKFVAVLHPNDAAQLDLIEGDRIKIYKTSEKDKKDLKPITAFIDISEDKEHIAGEIGLFTETFKKLNLRKNSKVTIGQMDKLTTVSYIKKKLNGKDLSAEEIDALIQDVVEDDLTEVELTYLVAGSYIHGLSDLETAYLTQAIVKHGKTLKFTSDEIVDKHCIGGVPGNRTTLIIVPIIAAAGLRIPKTSSRSITSPSGTADTMEMFANVTIPAEKLKKIVQKHKGFIAWGGGVDIAAADDHIIKVRHPLSLDPEGMMLASIMAKKSAIGSKKVLIDIPVGPQVKVKSQKDAKRLSKRFVKIGEHLGIQVQVILTDGNQPIGNGIGPSLEAIDVEKVLKNAPDAPQDLREKSLKMAGILLELGGKAPRKKGYALAKELLESQEAHKKFHEIIKAQGKSKRPFRPGKYKLQIVATQPGKVTKINCKQVSFLARQAGAPTDKYAGIYLHKKLGDKVNKDDILFEIYADYQSKLKELKIDFESPYTIH